MNEARPQQYNATTRRTAALRLAAIIGSTRDAELHAVTIRNTVSFPFARTRFDEHSQPVDAARLAVAA